MSLINKMLQDLEQRHADDSARSLPQDVRATPAPQSRRTSSIALAGLAALLLCALLAWLWLRPSVGRQSSAAVPTPVAVAAPAPVVMPEPVAPPPALALKVDDDLSMKSIAQIPPPVELAQAPAAPAPTTAEITAKPEQESLVHSEGKRTNNAVRSDMAVRSKPAQDVALRSEPRSAPVAESVPVSNPAPKAAAAEQPLNLNKQVKAWTPQQKAENDYRNATTLIQQGRVQEAIALLEQVLQADAAHVGARQTLIALMLNVKRRDDAMRLAQQGLELDVRQPNFAMILARLQLDKGDQKAAIATLQRSLPAAGNNAEYQAFLAALMQREGRHADAINLYESALDKAPQSGVWWMGLGISLQADNRLRQAREAFIHARETGALSPDLQAFVEQKIQQLAR